MPLSAFALVALATASCNDTDAYVDDGPVMDTTSSRVDMKVAPVETNYVPPVFGDPCTPGDTEACYNGPDGTLGVGTCQAGVRTCNSAGSGWGYCIGEVRPFTESCSSTIDTDCNGSVGCKSGSHLWSEVFGDPDSTSIIKYVDEMATDAAGNVLLTGVFRVSMTVGAQVLTASGKKTDAFLIKLDPSGAPLWARNFGGTLDDYGKAVTTDAAGNIYLTGTFNGTVDFGAGPLVSAGGTDIFLVKLDSSGNTLWSQRYGNVPGESVDGVALGPSGSITLAGRYGTALDFGLGPLPTSNSTVRAFVLNLDASGTPVWSRGFNVDPDKGMAPHTLSVGPSGNVVVAGYSMGWVNFGSGPVTGGGGVDGFVVSLSGVNGATMWSKLVAGPAEDRVAGVAHDAAGDVVVAGWMSGSVSLGGGTLTSAGESDILVAKLDATTGAPIWNKRLGNALPQSASAVTVDSVGDIVLLGHYNGSLDLGDGVMTSPSDSAISRFLAKLDSSGNVVWTMGHHFQTFSITAGRDDERALAVDVNDNVLFSATAVTPVDYGGGPIAPIGNYGGYYGLVVAKYAP